MSELVHPKFMHEECKDYQTLLDGMEVDHTPITLPCLPLLGPTLSASRQNKRFKISPDPTGEEETGDTDAFDSGTIPPGAALRAVTPPMSTTIAGGAVGDLTNPSGVPSTKAAIQAFLAAPLLTESTALKIDHITSLRALAT